MPLKLALSLFALAILHKLQLGSLPVASQFRGIPRLAGAPRVNQACDKVPSAIPFRTGGDNSCARAWEQDGGTSLEGVPAGLPIKFPALIVAIRSRV